MNGTPDFVIFLGRFHPLIVHLPIGILILAFVMELLSRKEKYSSIGEATSFVLFWGAISAWGAVILGLMLSQSGGYNEGTLFWHKWLGIFLAIGASAAWWIKKSPADASSLMKKAYLPLFSLSMVFLLLGGHNGGSLTHGSDYLVQYAPGPIRSLAGASKPVEDKPIVIADINKARVFDELIHPMVKQRCQSCHNEDKTKGGLRIDTREKFLEGGDEGPIFVANDLKESALYHRITLPEDHDDHMPPEGKRQLTDDQIAIIGWWIGQGAPMDQTVAEIEVPEDIREILEKQFGPMDEAAQGVFALQVPAADPSAIQSLAGRNGRALPIAQEQNLLQISFAKDSTPFANGDMKLLSSLSEQITWLDLRNTSISDFSDLAQLTHLSRLHLEQSAVQDGDLASLSGLQHLEYLNLYGTDITDDGLKHLENLPSLKTLYLWQSKVSKEGAEALAQKIPGLEINLGWDQTIKAKPEVQASI
ncbi:MAG: c-type cytochrome domain-containing protein [Bacteroidota bacterium]